MRASTDAIRRRRTDVAWAAGGLSGMLWAGSAVEPETASAFEIAVFRAFNDAPDFLYPEVWPLMQYGTFITIPVAAVIALLFHKARLALEMAVAGVAVYELAKLAKEASRADVPVPCSPRRICEAPRRVSRGSRRATPPCPQRSRSSCSRTCPGAGVGCR
jgi:hypothetical protein